VNAPEFSRTVRVDTLGAEPRRLSIEADEGERAALAKRFGIVEIARLTAEAELTRKGAEIVAAGRMQAAVTQSCVASGEPVAAEIDEPFELLFRPAPAPAAPDEEVELSEGELDVVFHDGADIDLGEAVAETLSLALDPYPRAPNAEEALKAAGVKSEEEAGPFGVLAGLRDQLKK
jgi:uncharacterized metal-binding protein YceD (DUF177 family)